jgi:2-hydroxy-6-oxonona-2,4-dienedioate hydrolase
MRTVLLALLAMALTALVVLVALYRSDINAARERVQGKSAVVSSPYGDIEYSQGGAGPDVLVIHGSGGGFDQGELMVQIVLDEHFHWIAPSRFGYLRSTFNEGTTFDDQAHAYAWLLDQLGIERVAVVALSHGGPSALLFALLHPERVSSLTLLSCGVTPVETEDQAQADRQGKMLARIFQSDFLYWSLTKLFRKQVMALMGADEAAIASLGNEQRELVNDIIDYMNPVSLRSAGVVFDNTAALPGARIATITAPTLIVHAEDDTLQLYDNAAFAAATIPGARLLRFERGGHFVAIIEQESVRQAVQRHILEHANVPLEAKPSPDVALSQSPLRSW